MGMGVSGSSHYAACIPPTWRLAGVSSFSTPWFNVDTPATQICAITVDLNDQIHLIFSMFGPNDASCWG